MPAANHCGFTATTAEELASRRRGIVDHVENRRAFERLLTHLGVDALILNNPDQGVDCLHQALTDGNRVKVAILDYDMRRISGVEVADNGEIAVDSWSKGEFDLILMDCRMPIMDGYEATRKIREIEKDNNLAPVPIIALTANASAEDRILCQQAGMNDVISKPFKKSDLYQVLQQWLSVKDDIAI